MFVGIMRYREDVNGVGFVLTDEGCNYCIDSAKSADPTRESIVAIEVVHPWMDYDIAQLAVDKVAGSDSVDVTLPVSSSHQTFGFDVTLTRLQAGVRTGAPAGSMVVSDTLQALNPRNAVNRLHAPDGYVLTRRFAVSDLTVGDQLQVDVTPIGRGVYSDSLRLDALAQTTTLTLPFSTPVYDAPNNVRFELRVFPNPAIGGAQVTLQLSSAAIGEVQFTVFDTVGRRVAHIRAQVNSGETSIPLDLSGAAPGIYVVRATTDNGQVATQRSDGGAVGM